MIEATIEAMKRERLVAPVERSVVERLFSEWRWRAPGMNPVAITTFGDWLLTDEHGAVWLLDTVEAGLIRLAASFKDLQSMLGDPENRDAWFLEGLARSAFSGPLEADHCLGWKVPPKLGGKTELQNTHVARVGPYQTYIARVHEQLAKLPEGARVSQVNVSSTGQISLEWSA